MKKNAVAYLRSSKDRSDVSIVAQRRALHDLAAERGLAIVDEYADAVESGKDDDRPAFQRLLHDLKASGRTWSTVLALDTSRIARRRHLALIFEHDCEKRGITIVYKNIPDTDPITGMLLRSILQAMDEWHSLTSKAKGLAGMAENVRAGWRAGGRAPRGYELEYHATGAIRDGQPVTKSKLTPNEDAQAVAAFLRLRADGVTRQTAGRRAGLELAASSLLSLEWQALTYAGHTVWGMHAERDGGRSVTGTKRRPRAEWQITRNTHPALINDDQAERILVQLERAQAGRRRRESPLLLTGLLVAPDGRAWHSDGCGLYRLGKGKKIAAQRLEAAVLGRIRADLSTDSAVDRLRKALMAEDDRPPVTPQQIQGVERRLASLAKQIGRTVDLAAKTDDPTPILRRVADLEHERGRLEDQLEELRTRQAQTNTVRLVTPDEVRTLLGGLFAEIQATAESGDAAGARTALAEMIERIELTPDAAQARVHYALTGDNVASRRDRGLSPVRWAGQVIRLAA